MGRIGKKSFKGKLQSKFVGRVDVAVYRMLDRVMEQADGPIKGVWETYKKDVEDEICDSFGKLNIPPKYIELIHNIVNKGYKYGTSRDR